MMPARFVGMKEQRGRGCPYCFDMALALTDLRHDAKHGQKVRNMIRGLETDHATMLPCPYVKCPYHELDGVKDYAKLADSQGNVSDFHDTSRGQRPPIVKGGAA